MRDIKKADKFDKAVERLNDQEELESVKSKKSRAGNRRILQEEKSRRAESPACLYSDVDVQVV